MTDKEKRSLKVRLGRRLSSDRPEVMEIVREEINKTPTTPDARDFICKYCQMNKNCDIWKNREAARHD